MKTAELKRDLDVETKGQGARLSRGDTLETLPRGRPCAFVSLILSASLGHPKPCGGSLLSNSLTVYLGPHCTASL